MVPGDTYHPAREREGGGEGLPTLHHYFRDGSNDDGAINLVHFQLWPTSTRPIFW